MIHHSLTWSCLLQNNIILGSVTDMVVKIYKQCFKNSFLDRVSHTEGILWTLYVAEANIEHLDVSVSQALVS